MNALRRAWMLPLAPMALTAAYIVNAGLDAGIHVQTLLRPLVIGIGVALGVTLLALLVTRRRDASGAVALGIVVLVLSGGAAGTLLSRAAWWQSAVLIGLVVFTAVLVARIVRRRWSAGRALLPASSANLFAGLLLLVVVVGGTLDGRVGHLVADLARAAGPAAGAQQGVPGEDIIVLVLDGHPRVDTLERLFDHDSTPFLDALDERGFFVADAAEANYAWTELTLLSMLHMQHVHDIEGFATITAGDGPLQPALRNLASDNPAFGLLREAGYRVTTVAPNIDHVVLHSPDTTVVPPGLSDFEIHLMSSTAIAGMVSIIDHEFFARDHRSQVLWGLDTVEELATTAPGGRLIVGHVLSPHMPAVFRADGSLRPVPFDHTFHYDFRALTDTPRELWAASFREQVEYLDARVIELLDEVIRSNPRATVILMSDHGSGSEFDATTLDTDLEERYAILFAARTPSEGPIFTSDQTPVNVFPALLGERLDRAFPRQPDARYFGYRRPALIPGSPDR